MEFLLVVGAIWLVIWLFARWRDAGQQRDTQRRTSSTPIQPGSKRDDVYRPKPPSSSNPRIIFGEQNRSPSSAPPSSAALAGLHDAFTGAPLNATLGLHQCRTCKVYYHAASVELLRAENSARCVACGSSSIASLTSTEAKSTKGRDYEPGLVTLTNYRSHFDRVVTFEGRVQDVKISKRGKDYALMFENASWTKGLKLVFFRGSVEAVGGAAFIGSLKGRTVRVRGLLLRHQRFGPEIIISERGMILSVA